MSILPISGSLGADNITQGEFKTNIEQQRQFIEDSLGTDSTNLPFYSRTEIDNTVVKNTGNETISGVKTFSSSPIVPTPSFTAITNDKVIDQSYFFDNTNFSGIEYADEDLLGTPDTSFSSTGARIYPDGTIRGKSSYGEYVKYPDGTLIIKVYGGTIETTTLVTGSIWRGGGTCYTLPHALIDKDTAVEMVSTRFVNGYVFPSRSNILSTTELYTEVSGATSTAQGYSIATVIGRWK